MKGNLMITKIKPGHQPKIEELREFWLNVQTMQSADKDVIETAKFIFSLLKNVKIDGWEYPQTPLVFIVDSPLEASCAEFMLSTYLTDKSQPGNQLGNQLSDQLSDQLGGQLGGQLGRQLRGQLGGQLQNQLGDQLWRQLRGQLGRQLRGQLGGQLQNQLGDQLERPLRVPAIASWYNVLSYMAECATLLGAKLDADIVKAVRSIAIDCPVFLVAPWGIIVSRKPVKITWENGELHCDNGPSILYPDGYKVWSIGGVLVDEQIVMRPQTQTLEQIHEDENEERRRIRIERYGWERYLKEVNPTVIDQRTNYIDNTKEALITLMDGSTKFVGSCRSTGRTYVISVPSDVSSCEAAQNWMMGGATYAPKRIIGAT